MYEDPSMKAERVQMARGDFSGASRHLRAALSKSHLITNPSVPTEDAEVIADIAVACGASRSDLAELHDEEVVPQSMVCFVLNMCKTFVLCFWNVRGLGDQEKCDNVLSELLSASPNLVLLQETKLESFDYANFTLSFLAA